MSPAMERLGFVAVRNSHPMWRKDVDNGRLFLWFQQDSKASDAYAGKAFTIELERTATGGRPQEGLSGRARLDQLLGSEDLDRILDHQNRIIGSLPKPPEAHIRLVPDSLRDRYRQAFESQGPYRPGDLWLRYHRSEDVEGWIDLLSDVLPALVIQAARLEPNILYLGQRLDLGR